MVHDFNTNRNKSEFLDLARGTTCYIKELQNCWTLYTESITQTFVEKPLLLRKMLRKNENHSTKKWDGDGHLGLHFKTFFFFHLYLYLYITRVRLVSSESFYWTRWIVDTCPLLDTCLNPAISSENFHWTQALVLLLKAEA